MIYEIYSLCFILGSHAGLPMDFFDPPRKTEEIGKKRHSNNSEDKLEQKKKIRTETIRTLHSSKNSTQDTKKPQIKDTGSDKEIKTSGLPSGLFLKSTTQYLFHKDLCSITF